MTRRIVVTVGALTVVVGSLVIGLVALTWRPGYDDPEDTPDTVREAWMRNRRNQQP